MAVLKRFLLVALAVAAVVLGAPAANAEDDNRSFGEHVESCTTGAMKDSANAVLDAMGDDKPSNFNEWRFKVGQQISKAGCTTGMAVAHPVAAASAAASKFWGDPVGKFTQALLEGNNEALQSVMTLWMDYRVDNNVVDSNVQGVKNIVLSLSGLALIASLVVGGGRIASERRRGLVEGVEDSGETIALYLLFSLLVPGLIAGAVVASDELSDWIMTSFGATSTEQVLGDSGLNDSMAGPVFMLGIAGVAFAGSVMQIIALAVRTLLLPIAAGLTPMMAAMSFTQTGKNGLHHLISLMIASVVFKPVSALLYCVAFWMSAHGGDDLVSTIMIAVMLGAAGFTGPALVRALVPVVAQAGGGGVAPVLAGGAAMTGGVLGMAGFAAQRAGKSVASAGQVPTPPTAAGGAGLGGGSRGGASAGPTAGADSATTGSAGGRAGHSDAGGSVASGAANSGPGSQSSGASGGESGSIGTGGAGLGGGSRGGASAGPTAGADSATTGSAGGRAGHSDAGGSVASGAANSGPGSQSSGASGGGSRSIGTGGAQPARAVADGAVSGGATGSRGARGGNRGRMGARTPRRTLARATGGALRAGGVVARTGAGAARTAGTAANRVQAILDESVGAQGNYGMRR
ncbi:hypothetical protein [uncultured Corynebacterium sp.]|uniref:hypothetical protein n=1 Tax=uncultured Corynebacterium sp. TaxID=159447 RepID=UPI00261A018A|nr:hypothetical protein [uncultured Corynebacterium sp.]